MRNSTIINISFILGTVAAFCPVAVKAAPTVTSATKDQGRALHAVISEDSVKWRRDPFYGAETKNDRNQIGKIPLGIKGSAKIAEMRELYLQGIMQADNAFHALINGRVVKTGDKLDGFAVVEISRYRVIVQNDNKEKSIYDIYQGRIDRGKNEK